MSTKEMFIKCDRLANIQQTERLPDRGIMVIAVHDDNTYCRWVEYDNMNDALELNKGKNKHVKCPRCGNDGTAFHTAHKKIDKLNIHTIRYYVAHKGGKSCY